MFPWTKDRIDMYKQAWLGWSNNGAKIMMRPNFTLAGHCFPIYYAKNFADCFALAYAHGLIGVDLDSLSGMYATQGPNLYMIARLQSNPDVSPDQVLNEFYGAFGPASEYIREYFEYLEKISDNASTGKEKDLIEGGRWVEFFLNADTIFTAEVFSKCHSILNKAVHAADGDETTASRVKFLQIGLQNAELTANTQKYFKKYESDDRAIIDFATSLQRLDKFRQENQKTFFGNIDFMQFAENRKWPRKMLNLVNNTTTQLPMRWKFMWDPEKIGEAKKWFNIDFDDNKWREINVGEFWEKQPVGAEWRTRHKRDYDGDAWYRHSFNVPKLNSGDRLYLLFGAVDDSCVIWINGQKVVDRPYPFKGNKNSWRDPFEVDITNFIYSNKPNIIAAKVTDSQGFGGVWKPVFLKIAPAPHTGNHANTKMQVQNNK